MSRGNNWNQRIIEEFRANGGKVSGHFARMPLLLVHTRGAKSGEERVNPVAYFEENGRLVIVASKGGSDRNPDWFHNLKANPQVEVEVGSERFDAVAEITEEPERSELYARMESINPGFRDYKKRTERQIPVVVLKRKRD